MKIKRFIFMLAVGCWLLAIPFMVLAQGTFKNAETHAGTAAGKAGVVGGLPEPYAAKIINIALSLVGMVFLLLMVYGGYLWMTAKGDEQQAKKAQDVITMGVIGMAIVIASYAASKFIIDKLVGGAI